MKVIDTYNDILNLFQNSKNKFDQKLWQIYACEISAELPEKCFNDSASYDFNKNIQPVLDNTINSKAKLKEAHNSFLSITKGLNERLVNVLGMDLEVDIILYVGLCNGAGWVTKLDNKSVILLGIEKIVELDWCDINSMTALIYHELGHIWHDTIGSLYVNTNAISERSVLQLYQEGMAMYFEQILLNDFTYYHQDENGWLSWCEENKKNLFIEYKKRIDTDESIQDFFGDWCNYQGYSDVGYYLGCELIKSLVPKYSLEELANLKIKDIYTELCNLTI